jgi:DNA-directed RNA polymerase specialized sigma subunit
MEHLNLIRKIAWSFHHSTGFDWNELFAEACWLYCKALKTYDPARGAVTTHVYQFITAELINFLKKEKEYKSPTIPIESMSRKDSAVMFTYFFESLSREAQKVAKVILENPEMFDCMSPDEAKRTVAKMLRDQGVQMKTIWCGIRDLKLAFQ